MTEEFNEEKIISGRVYCQEGLLKTSVSFTQGLERQRKSWPLDDLLENPSKTITCYMGEYLPEPLFTSGRWYHRGRLVLEDITLGELLEAVKGGFVEKLLEVNTSDLAQVS